MKTRRGFIGKVAGLTVLLAFPAVGRKTFAKSQREQDSPGELGGKFVHTVFFWLVDETMPTRGKFVTEVMKRLMSSAPGTLAVQPARRGR